MFEKIKKWYAQGLWTSNMIQDAIDKGVITEEQAQGILNK